MVLHFKHYLNYSQRNCNLKVWPKFSFPSRGVTSPSIQGVYGDLQLWIDSLYVYKCYGLWSQQTLAYLCHECTFIKGLTAVNRLSIRLQMLWPLIQWTMTYLCHECTFIQGFTALNHLSIHLQILWPSITTNCRIFTSWL